jgi:acetylornithine deacetylase/succinyl-diaminopimelate desuccinylase-like protein
MEIDLRSEDGQVAARLEAAVAGLAEALAAPDVQVFTESIGTRPGGGIPADHPLVVAAIRCLNAQGIQDVRRGAGSTDASAPLSQGLPAVCIGLTRGTMAHTVDEAIEIGPIAQGYRPWSSWCGKRRAWLRPARFRFLRSARRGQIRSASSAGA